MSTANVGTAGGIDVSINTVLDEDDEDEPLVFLADHPDGLTPLEARALAHLLLVGAAECDRQRTRAARVQS